MIKANSILSFLIATRHELLAANSGQSGLDAKKQPGGAPGCLEKITG
jgi:hypothetical protein